MQLPLRYRHTQFGTVVVVSLLLSAVLFAGLGRVTGLTSLAVIGPALMAVFLALFYALTVEIGATHLTFRFGIGWIRKRVPLAEIVEAQPVDNHWLYGWGIHRTPHGWLYGWGIHRTPHGWLYNVSGWEAVEITLTSGQHLRLGTDEPQKLTQVLQVAREDWSRNTAADCRHCHRVRFRLSGHDLGMILGGLPFLQLDRTGIALLGAIALVGMGAVTPEAAVQALHLPTLILLFAFMVLSAQLRLGGFYAWVTLKLAALPLLLGALMAVVAALAAVFSNDIVCLAVAPVLIDACRRRGLNPIPYLLALACAANVGSAATLIGNPQNMLIGATLRLSFGGYALEAAGLVLLGLLATWGIIAWPARGRWTAPPDEAGTRPDRRADDQPAFDPWQTAKGLTVAAALLGVFLFTSWPREAAALVGAGVLLTSRKLHSRHMLGLVDWELLVLFVGLFVVNHAFQHTGLAAEAITGLAAAGVPLDQPGPLFAATVLLSNLVSNVPAVMLLLPAAIHPQAGMILALASTLAGNLLLVGSIANLIVADAAARHGIGIDWRVHARVGIPVTLATLAMGAGWIGWRLASGPP